MKYADWNKLTPQEKRSTHWKHHPHMRTATVFTLLAAFFFAVFMLRVFQNKRVHVNRKPNAREAYETAKHFVNDRLLLPETSVFPKSDFTADIDTAKNIYYIQSTVNAQDSSGKTVKSLWEARLSYQGGDWADRKSWRVMDLKITTAK
ncbi:hypothetical protein D0C36_17905 [Mucilaginibacter conchicola]|uniref:Uncharacterized protein n=1 Tax=Mucilaginibacter conchicola TaxID=2303333 RepID=A0A372NQB7_9SPHI|nr:hypothetical protein [Mucilaginibacter conchicola]RFZ90827.1 hypothetical protein D0C36_17905 [Mucilaginibacter conchicola]